MSWACSAARRVLGELLRDAGELNLAVRRFDEIPDRVGDAGDGEVDDDAERERREDPADEIQPNFCQNWSPAAASMARTSSRRKRNPSTNCSILPSVAHATQKSSAKPRWSRRAPRDVRPRDRPPTGRGEDGRREDRVDEPVAARPQELPGAGGRLAVQAPLDHLADRRQDRRHNPHGGDEHPRTQPGAESHAHTLSRLTGARNGTTARVNPRAVPVFPVACRRSRGASGEPSA